MFPLLLLYIVFDSKMPISLNSWLQLLHFYTFFKIIIDMSDSPREEEIRKVLNLFIWNAKRYSNLMNR